MAKTLLVTTPDKRTWARRHNLLFLGSWCIHGLDQYLLHEATNTIVENPWSDQEILYRDYTYISALHDKLIESLAVDLNVLHHVNHSVRYWKILIGPWLDMFITSLYHRFLTLEKACNNYELNTVLIDYAKPERFIPNDMTHFSHLIADDDWNHYITRLCIEHFEFDLETSFLSSANEPTPKRTQGAVEEEIVSMSSLITRSLKRLLSSTVGRLRLFNTIFIFSPYLSRLNELYLNLICLGIPRYKSTEPEHSFINIPLRSSLISSSFRQSNAFECLLGNQIFRQIPSAFLEGYNKLVETARTMGYPRRPKVIFTSAPLVYNTVMMCYVAENIDRGAKLLCGQHGGYGLPKLLRTEDHEKSISDRFLTWGWSDNSDKTLPVGFIKQGMASKPKRSYKASKLLLVRGLWSPYPSRIDSGMGLDLNSAIEDSIYFASLLPSKIRRSDLLVRLYPKDYGYFEAEKWKRSCPDVEIATADIPIYTLIKTARLTVYSYNVGTGWLEYMAAGIPTILFWDMDASPVRESCVPYFELFRKVGIFHATPQLAAMHVERVWDDVEGWWNSGPVLNARTQFCREYINTDQNILFAIKKEISKCLSSYSDNSL